jgi:hypothetical protein
MEDQVWQIVNVVGVVEAPVRIIGGPPSSLKDSEFHQFQEDGCDLVGTPHSLPHGKVHDRSGGSGHQERGDIEFDKTIILDCDPNRMMTVENDPLDCNQDRRPSDKVRPNQRSLKVESNSDQVSAGG